MLAWFSSGRRDFLQQCQLGCIGLQLLLDALFESRQVPFRRIESVLLQLQKEAMALFQFSFQGQLQLRNLIAQFAFGQFGHLCQARLSFD